MESNINHQVLTSYSKSFAQILINNYFTNKNNIKGEEIPGFCEIKQINYFILKVLFDKWKSEVNSLKSPYFDFSHDEVQNALNSFMNVLSKNILIAKEDFKPLLEDATYKTILLIFSPYEYYLQEINKPTFQQISIKDLKAIQKYVKINDHLLKAFIERFHSDGIQAVFNDDAVRIFDEVCETIKETPEDFDIYHQQLTKVMDLDINEVYSQTNDLAEEHEGNPEEDQQSETGNINEQFKNKQQTLLDTLSPEKKEALIDIHEKKPLEGIKKSISINQRFMFENDLFNGDKDEFEMVVNYLDNCTNNHEAMVFLNENYVQKKNWDMGREEVIEFLNVINKRFPQ